VARRNKRMKKTPKCDAGGGLVSSAPRPLCHNNFGRAKWKEARFTGLFLFISMNQFG
jgi:hypothetical protein